MYDVNKEYNNILNFAFNISLVAMNNQASVFTEIQEHFIGKRIFSQKLLEY